MRHAYFDISIIVLLKNLIQGGERLQRPGLFGSLFPSSQIMDQDEVTAVPLVLPAQRWLQNRTGQQILQTPPPSGGGASRIHGSTTRRVFVSISVSISKYCRLFSYIFYVL